MPPLKISRTLHFNCDTSLSSSTVAPKVTETPEALIKLRKYYEAYKLLQSETEYLEN